jgi:hypothetical protein
MEALATGRGSLCRATHRHAQAWPFRNPRPWAPLAISHVAFLTSWNAKLSTARALGDILFALRAVP